MGEGKYLLYSVVDGPLAVGYTFPLVAFMSTLVIRFVEIFSKFQLRIFFDRFCFSCYLMSILIAVVGFHIQGSFSMIQRFLAVIMWWDYWDRRHISSNLPMGNFPEQCYVNRPKSSDRV